MDDGVAMTRFLIFFQSLKKGHLVGKQLSQGLKEANVLGIAVVGGCYEGCYTCCQVAEDVYSLIDGVTRDDFEAVGMHLSIVPVVSGPPAARHKVY